jgi:hypothetical protein
MTQAQLDRAVAAATGEALHTVRRLGFSASAVTPTDREAEELSLVLDCPFCGRPAAYPGSAGDGTSPWAECLRCDVSFEFAPAEVYIAGRDGLSRVA